MHAPPRTSTPGPDAADTTSRPLVGAGLALAGYAVFSLHDAIIKSVQGVPSVQIAFFAVLFSFVPFSLYLAVSRPERSFRPRVPGLVALRCMFNTTALLCGFYAFGHLPLTEAYSLLFSAPILITLLAIPFLGERIRAYRWFAIIAGLAGVIVVLRPGTTTLTPGHAAALGAAIAVACAAIVTRRIGSREHGVTLILYPLVVNVFVAGALTAFVYVPMPLVTLLQVGALGVLSVIGQALVLTAFRSSEAQFVAPMQYSQMLWALVYGALVFDEPIDATVLAGSAVIVFSGLLFIWRELVASVTRPVLRTRNLRISGGPQALSSEADSRRGEDG